MPLVFICICTADRLDSRILTQTTAMMTKFLCLLALLFCSPNFVTSNPMIDVPPILTMEDLYKNRERFQTQLLDVPSPKKASNPIILVPGDGGTQLWANLTGKPSTPHYFCSKTTSDYFDMWLNLQLFTPYVIDCWIDNMMLIYNKTDGTTRNQDGVDVKTLDWGNTSTVEWIDPSKISTGHYFATLADNLVHWGYTRGKNIRGAPFDFRKAPNEMGEVLEKMKALVEETYMQNKRQRVVMIGHSMGNPVIVYFLNQQTKKWRAKYIKSYISLSGPWGGSMKVMLLYASGYNFDHYSYVLNPLKCRTMQRTFPSSTFLMPSANYWNSSEIMVTTPKKNYTIDNYEEFFKDINYTIAYDMYQTSGGILDALEPPDVESHCVYGDALPTPGAFSYSGTSFPDTLPEVVYEEGDGTVNLRSLQGCRRWRASQTQPVHEYVVNGTGGEHIQILQSLDMVGYVHKVLYELLD